MMQIMYLVLIWCAALAILGTLLRMAIQWRRDGQFPGGEDWEISAFIEVFIGAVAGVLVWLVANLTGMTFEVVLQPLLFLNAIALGYAGADAVEGILKKYEPDPNG
jgi:hypothetical protein